MSACYECGKNECACDSAYYRDPHRLCEQAVRQLTAERDRLLIALDAWKFEAEVAAARLAQAERVVEAARAWRPIHGSKHDPCDPGRCGQRTCALTRAVDALDGTAGPGEEGGER